MNLKSIGISNFKAFGKDFQTVPIKPITLVFGPNSAGKSSLLHSLLWLNHVVHTGDCDVHIPRASLGNLSLGGFRQTRHRHKTSEAIYFRLAISCNFPSPDPANANQSRKTQVEVRLAYREANTAAQGRSYDMTASRIFLDGKCILMSQNQNVLEFDLENSLFSEAIQRLSFASHADDTSIRRFLFDLVEKQAFTMQTFNGLPNSLGYDFLQLALALGVDSPISFEQAGEFIREILLISEPIFGKVSETAKNCVGKLTYLPPVRELPPRNFDPSTRPESVWKEITRNPNLIPRLNSWLGNDKLLGTGYKLENRAFLPTESIRRRSPEILRRELWNLLTNTNFATDAAYLMEQAETNFRSLNKKSYASNNPGLYESIVEHELDFARSNDDWWDPPYSELSEDGRLERARTITDDRIYDGDADDRLWDHFLENFKPLAEYLDEKWSIQDATKRLSSGIETECRDRKYEFSLVESASGTRLALQDVGFGISQFLPILIHSFSSKSQLIAIEQPEIHIHPRLQAELGDVFIESALGETKNTFLLETHSEHLILRILRRIRETTRNRMEGWPEELRRACPDGIKAEDVAVLYVEPNETGSIVHEIRIDDQGRFLDEWPEGFFEGRLDELA